VLIDRDRTVRAAGGYIVSLLPGAPEELTETVERNIASAGPVTAMLDGGGADRIIESVMAGLSPRTISRSEVGYRCGCTRERVEEVLAGLGSGELRDIRERGEPVEVTCRFCDRVYVFSPEEAAGNKILE
jgi:molecular chaperone Hsp33